jgi:hypothetical protein
VADAGSRESEPALILVGQQRFDPGRIVQTDLVGQAAQDSESFGAFILDCLGRHLVGDWGDIEGDDKAANDAALAAGDRILSAYDFTGEHRGQFPGDAVWIITEWNRSSTMVMFRSDY